jgi:phosphate transport system substrate-binding protein
MKTSTFTTTAIMVSSMILTSVLAACGGGEAKTVRGDGSSTVFLISEAVAEEFQKVTPDVRLTVGVSGTGGGFKKFCAGETDFQNASRPIKQSEIEICEKNGVSWVELPIAFDGIAVVVHPENTFVDHLTRDELKKMWEPEAQGVVKTWSQIRAGWPDTPLKLFGAGVDSGTYDYFTEAIVGKAHSSRGDYTSSEDDNVIVRGVSADKNALGYFGFAYFEENQKALKAIPVDGGKGPVSVSVASIGDGSYFPLSRPLFLYVSVKALDRPEVKAFMDFYIAQAAKLSREVGYIPLPAEAYPLAQARIDKKKTGSLFSAKGSQIGVSIKELLALEKE